MDHFHAIRLANTVVEQVRCRGQQATLGHRGRKRGSLYRVRKLLLTAQEQLTRRGGVRLRVGLAGGTSYRWGGRGLAGQRATTRRPPSGRHAGSPLGPGSLLPLVRWRPDPWTVLACQDRQTWEAEILAFHTTGGCSNGPAEAVNLLIKTSLSMQ